MHVRVHGVVLRVYEHGKNSKRLTLLTREKGRLSAVARGAASLRGALSAASNQFVYGEYILFESNDTYVVDSADITEMFYQLRCDIVSLAAAQYMAECCERVSRAEVPEDELCRLLLNCLYALCLGNKSVALVKAAFELRGAAVLGFMPDISACAVCGAEGAGFLDLAGGTFTCADCATNTSDSVFLDMGARAAAAHIFEAPLERLFSFRLAADCARYLYPAAEKYFLAQTDLRPQTLDFYKGLADAE